jgi:hypothetical protein
MSNNETQDEEAVTDREKGYRRNRRPSVQFIDINIIRRRSSGNEKQPQRLTSINSNRENQSNDPDHLQQNSENLILNKNFFVNDTDGLRVYIYICFFFFLATASDSDSDAEDGSSINIRELEHVGFDYIFFFYIRIFDNFFLEKRIGFHGFCC